MGNEWNGMPKWVREGRTGPGSSAPRFKRQADRRRVRREWAKANNGGCAVLVAGLVVLGGAAIPLVRHLSS